MESYCNAIDELMLLFSNRADAMSDPFPCGGGVAALGRGEVKGMQIHEHLYRRSGCTIQKRPHDFCLFFREASLPSHFRRGPAALGRGEVG
jgi:hypothetical protein